MAARVNTRFVITLSAVLVLVFGGLLAAALWIKLHNAPELVRKGDDKMAAGKLKLEGGDFNGAQADFENAEKMYSRAVNKEQMNAAYLQRWADSLSAWVPENESRLEDKFVRSYILVLRQLAIAKKTDLKAHRDYLDLQYKFSLLAFGRARAENLITEVDRTLLMLKGDPQENGPAQALRRYRGLIITHMMSSGGMELSPEQIELARADLDAALKADPGDSASAVALGNWHMGRSRAALTNNDADLSQKYAAQARDVIADYAKDHPDDPLVAIKKLAMDVSVAIDGIRSKIDDQLRAQTSLPADKQKTPAVLEFEASRALAAEKFVDFERVATLFRDRAPDLSIDNAANFQDMEGFFEPQGGFKRSEEIYRRMIKAHPEMPEPYISLAQTLMDRPSAAPEQPAGAAADRPDNTQECIDLLQKVVDLPPRPIGLDAIKLYMQKDTALFNQSVYAFQKWENDVVKAPKGEATVAALEASRKYRATLAQYIPSDDDRLKFIDGLHQFAVGDWLGAKKLLAEYIHRFPGENIKADWHLALCERQLRNTGAALEMFDRIVRIRPDLEGPVVHRADLLNQLGRSDEAIRSLQNFLAVRPDSKAVADQLNRIRIASGSTEPTDPTEAALVKAERLLVGLGTDPPDADAALATIDAALATKPDPRLYRARAAILIDHKNDKEGSLAALKAGLAAYPDDKTMAEMQEGLSQADPVAWRLKKIDASPDLSDLDKCLTKQVLLLLDQKVDQADAMLDQAAKLAPEDQRVIDRLFTRAVRKSDWAAADKYVETAAAKDFDRVGGAMYKGRLQFARGQLNEAATTLKDAVDKGIADVATLRLLATIYEQLGRNEDAEATYKAALALRPGDAQALIQYINLLSSSGKSPEALARAKEAEPAARNSPDFINVLLGLEARVGNLVEARSRREAIYKKDPNNAANTLALADLCIDSKDWARARTLLDELIKLDADHKLENSIAVATTDGRYYAEQNQYDKVQSAFDDYIKRQDPARLKYDTFLNLGRFFIDHKKFPEGYAMMERGKPFQNPKVMEVDRYEAEILVEIGQPDNAALVLKRILDADADGPRQEVRIRLAELYVNLSMQTPSNPLWKEAQALLDQVKDQPANSLQVLLIRADVAHGLKDDKKAGEYYAQAAARFPDEPMVFFRRAQWHLARGEAGVPEALQDLDASIRVRPTFWQARRLRSFVYFNVGRVEEAIADVKETLKVNPSLDDLRLQLLRELIGRGRAGEAAETADLAVKSRPNDVLLAMSIGQVFALADDWNRAADYYRLGWNQAKRPDIAHTLLNAILNSDSPNFADIDRIFSHPEVRDKIETNSGLLLARAKLSTKRNRTPDAMRDVVQSTHVTPLTADAIGTWIQELRRIFPQPKDQLDVLARKDLDARFREWANYIRASILSDNPATRSQARTMLDDLLASTKDKDIRRLALRTRGSVEFADAQYTGAESFWHQGAVEFADDWELNNNLAYLLARYLDRPGDALPYAEKSGLAAQAVGEAVDTLGYVYMRLGRLQDAESEFKKAVALTRNPESRAAVLLHLVRCLLDMNKKDQAKVQLESVQKLRDSDRRVEEATRQEFKELSDRLGSP